MDKSNPLSRFRIPQTAKLIALSKTANILSHKGRKVFITQGLRFLGNLKKSYSTSQKPLQSFQSVKVMPPSTIRTQLPRPQKQKVINFEPANLEKLQDENLLRQLNQAPDVPTHKPGRSPKKEQPSLPLTQSGLNQTLNKTKTVSELIKVWNHLHAPKTKAALPLVQRIQLRRRFAGRLNMISKQPGQAKLITEKIIKTMIPYQQKRIIIGLKILENRIQDLRNNK